MSYQEKLLIYFNRMYHIRLLFFSYYVTLSFDSPEVLPEWLNDYPVTIIQFLFFLYRNFTDFMQVFMSAEVLGALAGTLFPKPASSSQDSSGASTPADEVIILTKCPLKKKLKFQNLKN